MVTIELPSRTKPGVKHTLTIHNGRCIGCNCDQKKSYEKRYGPFVPCFHMTEWNERKAEVEQAEKWREEAEKRAAYVAQFDPCGLGY